MDEKKLHGLMGLCVRARQAVFGEDGCMKTIRSGGCGILLLDERASRATKEKYEGVCRNAHVPLRIIPEGMLGAATGKPGVAMAVLNGGLCQQILMICRQEQNQYQSISNNFGGVSV